MGVIYSDQIALSQRYSGAMVYRNKTSQSFNSWDLDGASVIGPVDLSGIYQVYNPPFALGSGVYVPTGGKYVMTPLEEPVLSFTVVNAGGYDIYAGVNVVSGLWATGLGLNIGAGQSFTFGGQGEIIRNVWALASTGDILVQGYATNQYNPL